MLTALDEVAGPKDSDELERWLRSQYHEVRKLPDGSYAALMPLLFTTSLILGCDRWGYSKRFCFESPIRAREVFNALETEDDEPVGYIARR
jgi:hypothetical protein